MIKKGVWNINWIKWIIILIILVIIVSIIITVIVYKTVLKSKEAEDKTSGTLNINVRSDMSESQGTLNINVVGNESQK